MSDTMRDLANELTSTNNEGEDTMKKVANSVPHPYESSLDDAPITQKSSTTKTAYEIMKERRNYFESIVEEVVEKNLIEFREKLRALASECTYLTGDIDVLIYPDHAVVINKKTFNLTFNINEYQCMNESVADELLDEIIIEFTDRAAEVLIDEGFGNVYPEDGDVSRYRLDV